MKEEINHEEISILLLEISPRIQLITDIFPTDKESLLNHLAAAAIHLSFFARDVFKDQPSYRKSALEGMEQIFLEKCGCKDLIK
jgi:hypothetical protein